MEGDWRGSVVVLVLVFVVCVCGCFRRGRQPFCVAQRLQGVVCAVTGGVFEGRVDPLFRSFAMADPRPLFVTRSTTERTACFRGPLKGFAPPDQRRSIVTPGDELANPTIGLQEFSANGNVFCCMDHNTHVLHLYDATEEGGVGAGEGKADAQAEEGGGTKNSASAAFTTTAGGAPGRLIRSLSTGFKIQYFSLSPTGRFVATWHRYDAAAATSASASSSAKKSSAEAEAAPDAPLPFRWAGAENLLI